MKSDPLALEKSQNYVVALERYDDSVQRNIEKNEKAPRQRKK